jgi:GGDEF domain-containing protein
MFIVAPSRPRREDILAALEAGVWHVSVKPLDIDELMLRVRIYVSARRDANRASTASLVDVETGLYNAAGLARRSRELSSEAARRRTDLAIVAIGADIGAASLPADAALMYGEILRNTGRPYDVIGRLGPTEFVVLAPATGSSGAARFARRLGAAFRTALMKTLPAGANVRVRAGFSALRTLAFTPSEPMEMVSRAAAALRTGTRSPDLAWLSQSEIENGGPTA